jgi:hypothetical protein
MKRIWDWWQRLVTDESLAEVKRKDAAVVAELATMKDYERRDTERRARERIDFDGTTGRRLDDIAEGLDEPQPFIRLTDSRPGHEASVLVHVSEADENDEPGCNTCDGWVVVGSSCPDCGLKGWAKE